MSKRFTKKEQVVLRTDTAYRFAFTAQHEFTTGSRKLSAALFDLNQSVAPKGDISLADGSTLHAWQLQEELAGLHAKASEAEKSTDYAIVRTASDYHDQTDQITEALQYQDPDYAGVFSAASTIGYFLTNKHYPTAAELRAKFAWMDQSNPENIIAHEAGLHYQSHGEVIVRQALAMAAMEDIKINYAGEHAHSVVSGEYSAEY